MKDQEYQIVEVGHFLVFENRDLIERLQKIDDPLKAFKVIDEAFQKEIGAESNNDCIREIFANIPPKKFIHPSNDLFKILAEYCINSVNSAKDLSEEDKKKVSGFIKDFKNQWEIMNAENPKSEEKQPSKKSVEQRTLFNIMSPIVKDREGFVELIKDLIGDAKGKRVASVMISAWEEGCFLEKPTYPILMNTFQGLDIGNKSAYNGYLRNYEELNPKENKFILSNSDKDSIKIAFNSFLCQ